LVGRVDLLDTQRRYETVYASRPAATVHGRIWKICDKWTSPGTFQIHIFKSVQRLVALAAHSRPISCITTEYFINFGQNFLMLHAKEGGRMWVIRSSKYAPRRHGHTIVSRSVGFLSYPGSVSGCQSSTVTRSPAHNVRTHRASACVHIDTSASPSTHSLDSISPEIVDRHAT